jgi:8-oxo-dGTP diphosphatase
MLPSEFTLGQLKRLYEKALSTKIDKRNFRKKLFKTNLLEDLGQKADGRAYGQHKGSILYKFNMKAYQDMDIKGYHFQF